jgi:hypothetical protein
VVIMSSENVPARINRWAGTQLNLSPHSTLLLEQPWLMICFMKSACTIIAGLQNENDFVFTVWVSGFNSAVHGSL